MAEHRWRAGWDPIIISGKSKSWVLAGRWQMLCYKVLSYQHRPTSGTPKEPTEALQTHLQSTKTIRGLPKGVWPRFGKSKIWPIFNGVVGGSGVNWQLFRNALASIFLSHHMDRGSWAKRWKFLKKVKSKRFSGAYSVPIIISGKSKSGVLAVGGKCCVTKFSHINIDQCQALPNNQMKQYKPLSNQQNMSGALPARRVWRTSKKSKNLKNLGFWLAEWKCPQRKLLPDIF